MATLVNLDGAILAAEAARISVFDRGFLYGDSVYETVRTYAGRPCLLDRHLARLARSAARLWIELPGGVAGVGREVLRTLAAAANPETSLRIMISRGGQIGQVSLDLESAGPPGLVIIARPFSGFERTCYEQGVDVAVVSVRRTAADALDPSIKSGNYLNNILALREARQRQAFECLMLNQHGHLAEASTSNVFLVSGGALRTPALACGLLDGITRSFLIEVATAAGYPVREEELSHADLLQADEVFLTSSLKEVMPVRAIDGRAIGGGRPGAVTLDLLERYRAAAMRASG